MHKLLVLFMIGCSVTPSAPSVEPSDLDDVAAHPACDYPQIFGTPSHTGTACPEVTGMRVVAQLVQDPDADAENAASGFLQIHESPPLTAGNFVVVPSKRGFTSRTDRSTETWSTTTYRWTPSVTAPNATLEFDWTADATWKPVDVVVGSLGSYTNGYVQQFAPAIANDSLYVPGASGTVVRRDLATGAVLAAIDPLAATPFSGDALTVGVSALSVDHSGHVYYTVTAFPTNRNRSSQARASWLVRLSPDNTSTIADWTTIASSAVGVPQLHDPCEYPFGTSGTGKATDSTSRPPIFGCGNPRPAFNAAVSISDDDSRLVMFSYANNAQGAAFVIAVDAATLSPVFAADTRGHFLHGCGVRLDHNFKGDFTGTTCDTITDHGATGFGFDPDFNGPERFNGEDLMDSTPTIAPNGDIAIGSYDGGFQFGGGNDARGAGVVFDRNGGFVATNDDMYWEVTASVLPHADGTFSYLQDRQLFSAGLLSVAQLSATETVQTLGSIAPDKALVQFLDANIVFGTAGDHYAVASDGLFRKFNASGAIVEAIPLLGADGAVRRMNTLSNDSARDRARRIYVSYAGIVYVISGS